MMVVRGSKVLAWLVVGLVGGCASRSDVPPEGVATGAGEGAAGGAPAPIVGMGSPDDVVAQVLGAPVKLGEVDKLAENALARARLDFDTAVYEARKAALDGLIDQKVIDAEAKKRGMTAEALSRQEIDDKVPALSEAELKDFYTSNQDRMGGESFEGIRDRIAEYLGGESKRKRRSDFIAELRKAHGATVALSPARVPVEAKGPVRGAVNAPVKVVVFADFECPYCSQTAPTLDQLEEKFRGEVQLIFRHYPLPFHAEARPAAEAAACAGEQKKFWDVHDQLFGHKISLDQGAIRGFLQGVAGFDLTAYDACLAAGRGSKVVTDDLAAGERAGVDGTPAFFINGIRIGGAQPYEQFESIVKEELVRLGAK